MIPHKKNNTLTSLFTSFEDILDQRHPLFILANKIDWKVFEDAFTIVQPRQWQACKADKVNGWVIDTQAYSKHLR